MHYHIEWSSTGFSTDSFDSYGEAHEIARQIIEELRCPTSSANGSSLLNETFKVEPFDVICPICAKRNGAH